MNQYWKIAAFGVGNYHQDKTKGRLKTFPTDNGRSFRRSFRRLNQAVIDGTIHT
ncbi:hypothetical protein [Neisseria sicca]|uniref:hypothetical protein n=1 Tax=Neisseria sicca TaxID=490 RepID=UPI0016499B8B|nr:hypothetical protein [Neisseria sicca]